MDDRQLSFIRQPTPALSQQIDQAQKGFKALNDHMRKRVIPQLTLDGFRFPDLLDFLLRDIEAKLDSVQLILDSRYKYLAEDQDRRNSSQDARSEPVDKV